MPHVVGPHSSGVYSKVKECKVSSGLSQEYLGHLGSFMIQSGFGDLVWFVVVCAILVFLPLFLSFFLSFFAE